MTRGEVWWAKLPDPIRRRPVLILSRRSLPPGRGEITVAYITTNIRGLLAIEVSLSARRTDAPKPCVVNLDSINTIPKAAFVVLICTLSAAKMDAGSKGD